MRGILILGGLGTRLGLFSRRVNNKALALVYNRLVFEYPLNTLVRAGITDITIVTGARYSGEIINVIGDGTEFGVTSLTYTYQKDPKGISDAIYKAKDSCSGQDVAVILGDNFFEDDITEHVKSFKKGCSLFIKEVPDPERYGVAEVTKEGTNIKVTDIIEKPKDPKTNLAVTGLYLYDSTVFNKIEQLKPSPRGELEVTDLNMLYVKEDNCNAYRIKGHWDDMGTYDSIIDTANFVRDSKYRLTYQIDAWKH